MGWGGGKGVWGIKEGIWLVVVVVVGDILDKFMDYVHFIYGTRLFSPCWDLVLSPLSPLSPFFPPFPRPSPSHPRHPPPTDAAYKIKMRGKEYAIPYTQPISFKINM